MKFEIWRDAAGEYRWHLKAGNNKIIADSGEGYFNRGDALAAIGLVRMCGDASLVELETKS